MAGSAILDWVIRDDTSEEMTFKQRPDEVKESVTSVFGRCCRKELKVQWALRQEHACHGEE